MELQTNHGFTLIESLVAITILLIGVLGPMTAATRGITDGLYAGNQLMATYLAQEGLELLSAQVENNNRIGDVDGDGDKDGDDFLFNLDSCIDPAYCAVTVDSSGNTVAFSFSLCAAAADCDIAFDSSSNGNFYKLLSGCPGCNFTGLVFSRKLQVKRFASTPTQALLIATVEWSDKSAPNKSFSLSRYAFDKPQ